jgi:tetratricopeptide (TPR) repeat protein
MQGQRSVVRVYRFARLMAGGGMLALMLSACAAPVQPETSLPADTSSEANTPAQAGAADYANAKSGTPSLAPTPHDTITTSGHYLAARQALYFNDVGKSADFFLRTLEADAKNVSILRQAFLTQYYYGDIERAAALGRQLESMNVSMPLGGEPGVALAIRNRDWPATLILSDKIAEDSNALIVAGIIAGWALVADAQGDAGISRLLETDRMAINQNIWMDGYFHLHAALMAEYLGLDTEARQRVNDLDQQYLLAQTTLELAAFHARQGQWQEAIDVVDNRLSKQFNRQQVLENLKAQRYEKPDIWSLIATGIVTTTLSGDNPGSDRSASARLRLALFIDPDHAFARILLAQQLADFGQYDAALKHLGKVPTKDNFGQLARLTEAFVVEEMGDNEAAISLLQALADADNQNDYLFQQLGNSFRRNQQFEQGRDAYMRALELGNQTGALYRSLGVCLERLKQSNEAERYLLRAIEVNPGDAYALNYLGYWWADEGRNLDEAIALIERAVGQRPDSGFFVDSLGWVHFKLGDPEKAVSYLEKATELEPADAEITAHLGDVYWMLGRIEEAQFKWRLALSLSTDETQQQKIKARIAYGLTADGSPAKK